MQPVGDVGFGPLGLGPLVVWPLEFGPLGFGQYHWQNMVNPELIESS